MRKLDQIVLSAAMLFAVAIVAPYTLAQDNPQKTKPTAGGQMKEGSKEMGKAGKSLGSNVKHGRVARGGKQFGKHVGRGSKHIAKGTAKGTTRVAKKTGTAVKKAVKP